MIQPPPGPILITLTAASVFAGWWFTRTRDYLWEHRQPIWRVTKIVGKACGWVLISPLIIFILLLDAIG